MDANTIDVSDLRTHKFYHLYAKHYNKDLNTDKELLICVDGHAIYYQVQRFDHAVKMTASMEEAVDFYNNL